MRRKARDEVNEIEHVILHERDGGEREREKERKKHMHARECDVASAPPPLYMARCIVYTIQ